MSHLTQPGCFVPNTPMVAESTDKDTFCCYGSAYRIISWQRTSSIVMRSTVIGMTSLNPISCWQGIGLQWWLPLSSKNGKLCWMSVRKWSWSLPWNRFTHKFSILKSLPFALKLLNLSAIFFLFIYSFFVCYEDECWRWIYWWNYSLKLEKAERWNSSKKSLFLFY